jgi:hypothetical protein
MPRYFFHVRDGKELRDDVGHELPNLETACQEAIVASGQMLQSFHHPEFWNGEDWTMFVTDETGRELFTIRFSGRLNVEQAA